MRSINFLLTYFFTSLYEIVTRDRFPFTAPDERRPIDITVVC